VETITSAKDAAGPGGAGGSRPYLWAALIVIAAVFMFAVKRYRGAADCDIHASASIVTRDAPISRQMNITTDMLMLRNEDGDTWKDVVVTASGSQRIGTQGRQPSGTYTLPATKLHNKGGLYAIEMNDFEKVDGGSRWVSLTMSPERFTVKATVNGQSCSVEVTPGTK